MKHSTPRRIVLMAILLGSSLALPTRGAYYSFFELLDQMTNLSSGWTGALTNFPTILILAIAAVVILGAFLVIAIQMAVALLFFKIGSLAVLILLPFGMLNPTAFIAERPIGWVMASGVRVLVLTLVCSIGFTIFDSLRITSENVSVPLAINVAIQSILLMVIAICANRLAGDLMSGGPTLGAGNVASAATGAALIGGLATKVAVEAGGSAGLQSIRAAAMATGKGGEYGRALAGGTVVQQIKSDAASVISTVKEVVRQAAGRSTSPWATVPAGSSGGGTGSKPRRTISMEGSFVRVSTPGLAATRDEAGRAAESLSSAGGGGGGLSARLGDHS